MTAVYCFSGSGHSFAVAQVLSHKLGCELREIGFDSKASAKDDVAVVVFPVYCQNIPAPVQSFLRKLKAKHIVLIGTYGKISYGNVLYEAQKLVHGEVIAGAYIPIGHTFLSGDCVFDDAYLLPIAERIQAPQKAHIPKTHKNPLADIFPALRSRMGVKLIKTDQCNHCGLCETLCPMGAIQNGQANRNCIRCLRCVTNCPQKALQYKSSAILQKYLLRYYKAEYVLYL